MTKTELLEQVLAMARTQITTAFGPRTVENERIRQVYWARLQMDAKALLLIEAEAEEHPSDYADIALAS